jgi:serine-type D-Ala-D-Ala carboxypeptidase (penicillin-binding protein 5/6)
LPKTLDPARTPVYLLALTLIAMFAVGGAPDSAGAQQPSSAAGAPEVEAQAWAIADADSGRVLASENADEQIKMASTAKVMTALVVLESDADLDERVVISEGAEEYVGDTYSNIGLISGESVTARDLLEASLIPSGTDADYALAEYVGGGSVEQFVQQMNQKAEELGLENTNFTNPTGIDAENNYSSAEDLLKITSAALEYELFRELIAQTEATIETQGVEDREIQTYTTNELLYSYPAATGVKTGTGEEGYMLISSAEAQQESYIAAVLGADSSAARFTASENLLSYAFGNFEQRALVEEGQVYAEKEIPFRGRTIELTAADTISATVEEGAEVERRIRGGELPPSASEGDEVGQVEVIVGEESVGTSALLASEGYEEASFWQKTTGRVTGWIGGLFG